MKSIFNFSVLVVLLAIAPHRCLALRSFGHISPTEAKEMGLKVQATSAGPEAVWLELEFKVEGKLKEYRSGFSHVELEVREGEKPLVGYVALQEKHPEPGHVRVRFIANRAYIDKLILTIVVGEGGMAGGAYELHVKEFVER